MLNNKTCQHGVTLIESMIALLVISIGLLGIASLQITAMSQNTSALNHSQAVWIASSMSDRIRANIGQFNNYDGIDTNNSYDGECETVDCSDLQMIEADADEWSVMIESLPGGRGMIDLTGGSMMISVMWDDDGTGVSGTGCDPTDANDLTCFRMVVTE